MKTNRSLLIASGSALAAGMAQGAVHYSGLVTNVVTYTNGTTPPATGSYFDLNNDGTLDFYLGFDGLNPPPNAQKPFIAAYPQYSNGSAVLSRPKTYIDPFDHTTVHTTYGLPVTSFGTMIDQNFLAPDLGSANYNAAYFYQDGNTETVGDWQAGAKTEAYVGLEVFDASLTTTNF